MINSISSNLASSWASSLFSKLDTKNQGYLEKSDLESALSTISGSNSTSATSSANDVFSQLDSNGDGKITQDEMTSTLQNMLDELNSQFDQMRMHGTDGKGSMPPPPPPQEGDDKGFTKEELTSQLQQIGSSDSKRSELLSNIIENFDKADSNGDGKVSFQEAMAYDKSTQGDTSSASASTSAATTSDTLTSSANTQSIDNAVMIQIMKLLQAYQVFGETSNQSNSNSLFSTSA